MYNRKYEMRDWMGISPSPEPPATTGLQGRVLHEAGLQAFTKLMISSVQELLFFIIFYKNSGKN